MKIKNIYILVVEVVLLVVVVFFGNFWLKYPSVSNESERRGDAGVAAAAAANLRRANYFKICKHFPLHGLILQNNNKKKKNSFGCKSSLEDSAAYGTPPGCISVSPAETRGVEGGTRRRRGGEQTEYL